MENQKECLKLSRFWVENSRFKKKRLFGALTVKNLKVLKMLYTLPTKIKNVHDQTKCFKNEKSELHDKVHNFLKKYNTQMKLDLHLKICFIKVV